MKKERSYRGWVAAVTVAAAISWILIYVEKYVVLPGEDFWALANRVSAQVAGTSKSHGIILEIDAGLVGTSPVAPNQISSVQHRQESEFDSIGLMRRPPELASNAVLREPLSAEEFVSLPLSNRSSSMDTLLASMEQALKSPVAAVSLQIQSPAVSASELNGDWVAQRLSSLQSPAEMVGKIPPPNRLFDELSALRQGRSKPTVVQFRDSDESLDVPHYVASSLVEPAQEARIQAWVTQVESHVKELVQEIGLESQSSQPSLQRLTELSKQGQLLAEQLQDHSLAAAILRSSYSLDRRVAVWTAIQGCLDGTSIGLIRTAQFVPASKVEVAAALKDVETFLASFSDRQGWRTFLLLDRLSQWVHDEQDQMQIGSQLSRSYLSRISWGRLDDKQRDVLQHESIGRLADRLSGWGHDPIDYRHLLASIERIEQDPTNRLAHSVADTLQVLGQTENAQQRLLAETLNTHYRNANLRLTVSHELIERFLPEGQYEVRPVRQRILGADTAGDSKIHTEFAVNFFPDPNAWHIELGIRGDMVSSTRSSKGPAVFHNTGSAQVNSSRFLKMNPSGYSLTAQPAQVTSSDQLQKMSTDFDGLPVVGDLVRLLVREQFNQKRGLARRVTERIIAKETDAEIDRKLAENLKKAEQELNERILGPLQRLTLNPMVVSMSTTTDRLAIRYRLADESQLGAHTPRPRAPGESLTSFQLHQTVLNNAIENVGLSGKDWRLPDLYQSLGKVFQAEWSPPAEVPEDITVRFADHRPISVEMENGKVRLHLRIARFQRDQGIDIQNFIVTSTYIPVAEGLKAGLVRDPESAIEIQARHLPVGDRLALRVIFSKVFVSNPSIPLISEQWIEDPRAKDLAVSQLDIRDGWLAVAISNADSQLATEVTERARAAKAIVR